MTGGQEFQRIEANTAYKSVASEKENSGIYKSEKSTAEFTAS